MFHQVFSTVIATSTDGGMGFSWLIALLILGLVFYFFRDKKKGSTSAQNILDKRYASGGITKEKYEEKSTQLQKYTLKRITHAKKNICKRACS